MYCFLWARCNQVILSMCIRWPCQLKNITLVDSTSITINLINKPRYMHTFYWANWWCICSIKHVCCFQLKTNHKPFEWLMVILNVHGRCMTRWIDLLQYFSFKIMHKLKMKHDSANTLSKNLMDVANGIFLKMKFETLEPWQYLQ